MGNSLQLPAREPPGPMLTAEMELTLMDMLDVIARARQGELVHTGALITEEPRFTEIRQLLRSMLPEFDLVETGRGLFGMQRRVFSGELGFCCTHREQHYWEDTRTREHAAAYAPGRALRTCAPWTLSKDSPCDQTLFAWCAREDSDAELCKQWLGAAFARHELVPPGASSSLDKLVELFARRCAQDVRAHGCEDWLHAMRVADEPRFDRVIDAVLAQQEPEFKRTHMACSYPSHRSLELARRVAEPRECWDPQCQRANPNFLLSENYHALADCHIYRCNVSIGTLLMDKRSKLRISCHDPSTRVQLNKLGVVQDNARRAPRVRTHLLAALALILVWVLIVAL
ncbi:MC068 [Molluscum contagiosum virus subtype 2]|uniref:MC068 n=2 Tax=Molluscum contagiosum virus TaxID=10279 RepID=A0A1S7DLQ9_MCV2|nr:MC068 [Molluscum contagiosum virus subtype 2]QHW16456.1 MC068R [Molluscum contagiosum virus]AYO87703.1 MC068 [Molluscum contagiosum virus subtype 2]AYO87873.1 MC068 [Molluscum contagiosum virus subtype 2]AYO88043.1 MC068 [Molluscum contagiosum virus subtype 2]